MITTFLLLFLAIAKVSFYTGIGPGLVIVIFLEWRGVRIVALGIERVSARAVSCNTSVALERGDGNKPARDFLEAA